MRKLRTILTAWPKKESSEPKPETSAESEPVFSCDCRKQFGYLHLKRGKWAGKWVAKLRCCENPLCDCADVNFYCAMDDGSERPPALHFALDPMHQTIATNRDKERHKDSAALAEAVVAEFGEEEWRCLRRYLLTRKRKAIRYMDVTKLPVPASPSAITDDGRMAPFGEIFPFGGGFEFELDGEHWMADDQYCVMPNCDCREVALSFLCLTPSPDGKNDAVKEAVAVARYDYKRDTIRAEREPAVGQPSLRRLVDAARAAHPYLATDAELRHNQLKLLYARALANVKEQPIAGEKSSPPAGGKVSRNDPCPCGSGKKHKKCCGIPA